MARKAPRESFAQILARTKAESAAAAREDKAYAESCRRVNILLYGGEPRTMDAFFQNLAKQKKPENGYQTLTMDTSYREKQLDEGEERAKRAFVLTGTDVNAMREAAKRAASGLPGLVYHIVELE